MKPEYPDLKLAQDALRKQFGEVEFSMRTRVLPEEEEEEDSEEVEFLHLPMALEPAREGEDPDLYSLRAFLTNCPSCELCESRTKVVFGSGNESPDLVIIGDAPSKQEDKMGEPFVGRPKKMLDAMLQNVLEMKRQDVYLINALKCLPPSNRGPSAQELLTCRGYLDRQLKILKPKVILLMGRIALEALFPEISGISRHRGKWLTYNGIDVMPTFHPSFLMWEEKTKRAEKLLTLGDLKEVKMRLKRKGDR